MATSINSAQSPRQLIIGVDSMEWSLVQRWAAAGKLPTFASLMREGAHAELTSLADRFPDQSWNYLCSGKGPAHFARYFYIQYDPATGGLKHMSDSSPGPRYFWDLMSDAGLRVGVLDVPHVGESARLNGYQLAWGEHGMQGPRFSHPASMLPEVCRRYGPHPVGECDGATTTRAKVALRDRLLEGVKLHGKIFRHYTSEPNWDAIVMVFGETHCAGHIYWHDMDRDNPTYNASDTHYFANSIEEVYAAVDREIGSILQAAQSAGANLRTYIVSAHGMGPLCHASWNLQDMLDALGYGGDSKPVATAHPREGSVNFWRTLRMIIPGGLQYAVYGALPRSLQNELVFRFYRGHRRWERCRAFAVPNNDTVGAIRINLKGRDRNGVVEPHQYEPLCDEIAAALTELRDAASGTPVVKQIAHIHRDSSGPYLEQLPDLTVQWDASFPWSSVCSPNFGTINLPVQDLRTGSHTAHGFLIASGGGIPCGATLMGASILDVAPTILHTAGVNPPEACEGRPLFPRCE